MNSLKDAFKQIFRNFSMCLASFFSVTAILLILGVFFIIIVNINVIAESAKDDFGTVQIFLKDSVSVEKADELAINIKNNNDIENVTYKTKNSDKNKKKYEINDETVEYFTEYQKLFDFELTDSQKEVMRSIENDLSSDEVMNRLLLGDVGSGKTIVFSYALYLSKKNNFQSIVLVPTTFLAIQHFNTLTKLFKNTDIKVSLLISSTKKSGETKIKNEIKTGDIDIVIGTTSLISPDISFKNLNLVVFDEQHKFGVAQKETLVKNTSINTISVSATPIPRTLSHSIFGKLNTSVLTEKPKNRIKTKTFVLMKHEKEQA
ncbi:MAG: ATP-dependent DNA helicase RecG partial [Methanobrevibacter sp. CfCl-M3]